MASSKNKNDLPGAFELFKPSWEAVRLNIVTLIEFVIVPVGIALLGTIIFRRHVLVQNNALTPTYNYTLGPGVFIAYGISGVLWLFFGPGMTYTLLKSAKKESVDFLDAFKIGLHYFWRYLAVSVCAGLIILGGLILLIIPGIFMIRRYFLASYYLIDRDLGVVETLKVCADESKKYSSSIWGLLGVELMIGLINIVPLIGQLISFVLNVTFYGAPAIRYRQITAVAKSKK